MNSIFSTEHIVISRDYHDFRFLIKVVIKCVEFLINEWFIMAFGTVFIASCVVYLFN